jgi:glycerol-3-phosphate O-acyltransferase/dihydroxyacetone phosphate acyltransferase
MLYRSLKFILQIAIRVFFRKVYIRNKELIPEKGPMLICANHPATFLDPLVIAASIRPEIYFLSKGGAFNTAFARWMLPKLNMIPIYRQQDDPSLMHKNKDTFIKCFEHLERGGVILIFPEGLSLTERKLRKLKTGTARIALGAEARNDFKLGVKILNIGLNYTNPHKFNQDLFMNVDKPIEVRSFREKFKVNEGDAAHELTECIRESLEKHIIAIEDEQSDQLVRQIEIIYKEELAKDVGLDTSRHEQDFQVTRSIVETVAYFKETDPVRVETIRKRIDAYFERLGRAKLSDGQLKPEDRKGSLIWNNLAAFCFLIAGFPLYVYGLIGNILPFEIPTYISKRFSPSTDFIGAIALVTGTFFFALFYTVQIILFHHIVSNGWLTLIYALSLPVSGLFTYAYWYVVKDLQSSWLFMSLFYKRASLVSGLIKERMEIIEAFDQAKADYRERMS